ncbi:MAG: hypothetical protein AB7H96_10655 [Vicinamibacterales bacterium]
MSLPHVGWMVRVVLLATSVAAAPFAVRAAAAQDVSQEDYLALVQRYPVDPRGAVQALSDLDDRALIGVLPAVLRGAETWPSSRLETAALLHTEVVTGGWVLPQHAPTHLDIARRFVEAGRGRIVSDTFHRRWLLAVCWHYQSELEFGALVPWLDELRERYGTEPETDLALGIFYETLVWNGTVPSDLTWNGRSRVLSAVKDRTRQQAFQAAAAAYRRAGVPPGTHDAASVRLGRVLGESGQHGEARTVLTSASSGATERRWRYLAALFLGRTETLAGRPAAAEAAFDRAMTLMDGCQTPLVGLIALKQLEGRGLEAVAHAEALTEPGRGCEDPWWFYRFGQPPDRLPQLIAEMREAITP